MTDLTQRVQEVLDLCAQYPTSRPLKAVAEMLIKDAIEAGFRIREET